MTKEVIVESFELDHTAVKAPYVRLIGEETGPKETSSLTSIFVWCNPMKMRFQLQGSTRSSTFLQCLFANASMV